MQATEGKAETRYLDYNGASRYVGLSRFTLHRKVKAGELQAVHIGSAVRFDVRDLDRFMNERRS